MPVNPIRMLVFVVSLLICAAGLICGPPIAYGSPHTDLLQARGVVSVDRTTFFDEGKYINLADHENDIEITDFSASGGKMVALADGGSRYAPDRDISPYRAMQIYTENVYGNADRIPGFGFLCDKTASAANGASVSVYYDYIGDMKDIADASFSVPVALKTTYTIRDGKSIDEEGDYSESYTGHPLVQIPKCFSHGVFFVGTDVLDTRYEFFDANTGSPLELGRMYVTATSLNRGEGFAVPSDRVSACYVSNEAPAASRLYNRNGVKTPYSILPGSLLYDKTAEYNDGYTTFIGCPDVFDGDGSKIDFSDLIGEETFYWRSVCFAVDCGASNAIDAKAYAIKTASWSGTAGIAGDGYATNGSMWFATNFMTLTSITPPAPSKTADKADGVRLGDTVTYRIAQQVNDLGATSFIRYDSLILSDALPSTLQYKGARLLDDSGAELEAAGTAHFDEASRLVTFEFSRDFCENGMAMAGETYYLEIAAEVVDYPDDDTLSFSNSAKSTINGIEQTTEEVVTELVSPELAINKYSDPDPSTADEYEFLVGDEITFHATVDQIRENTRAREAIVSDTLPEGLKLVPGSVEATGCEGAETIETEAGWTVKLKTFDYGKPIEIAYRATAAEEGNGTEVVNTAEAHAKNIEAGVAGAETLPATDEAEVFINSPRLVVAEEVSVSPSTENSYEHRVGEPITFALTVENTVDGTIANDLALASLVLPEGMSIADGPDAVRMEGMAFENESLSISYPTHGDDSIHRETEQRLVVGATEIEEDRCGASLTLSCLPSDTPVRLMFTCVPTEEANGLEVLSRGVAHAKNATAPTQNDPAARVWINSPRLEVSKQAPSLAYQTGDVVTYHIDASNTACGTLANNVVFEDVFETPGMELLRNSIVVSDQDGDIVTDQTTIVQNIGTQDWKVETNGALVNTGNHRIWDCDSGGALIETSALNPLEVEREHAYRIEYQALITDQALASQTATNRIAVTSDENLPATDEETVSVAGPALGIAKTADRGSYRIGEIAEYTIEVASLRTGETAHDVRIGDEFSSDSPRAAIVLEDSVALRDHQGRTVSGWDIEWIDNDTEDHVGFTVNTHADLPDSSKFIVSYKAKFAAKTPSGTVGNTAWTEADDAPRAQASCTVASADPDSTSLVIEKSSDGKAYAPGCTARYSLAIRNTDEAEPARNVHIADELEAASAAQIARGSIVVSDADGNTVEPTRIDYRLSDDGVPTGFSIETGASLSSENALIVTYESVIDPQATAGDSVKNIATASADNTGDAFAEHEVAISDASDTSDPVYGYTTTAYKTANPASGSAVDPGSVIAYLITVRNTGDDTAPTTRVRDYVPEGTTYVFESATDEGAFVRASDERSPYIEWVLTDLAPASERTIGFSVQVNETIASGRIINEARYSTTSAQETAGDPTLPEPERITARVVHSVGAEKPFGPIVNVVKSSAPAAGQIVQAGNEIDYTLVATNQGDEAAKNVLVHDPLPTGATFAGESTPQNCTYDRENNQIEWLIPTLNPGEAAEASFRIAVESTPSIRTVANQASFASEAIDLVGSNETLDNTSNIVEHPLPATAGTREKAAYPRTGDSGLALAIGAVAALALGLLVTAAFRAKRAKEDRRPHRIDVDVTADPRPRKTRAAKRRRKNYLRWK